MTYKSRNCEDVSFQIEEKLLLKIDFSFVFLMPLESRFCQTIVLSLFHIWTGGLNTIWCGAILLEFFTKLYGIEKFSGKKDFGKTLIIIIILFLIIITPADFCLPRKSSLLVP